MASVTREQIARWNAKVANGFTFDTWFFLTHHEKRVTRLIDLDDGRKLRANVEYTEERDRFSYTGKYQPVLHLSVWTVDGEFMRSSGLGKYIKIGSVQPKRNYNELVKLTAQFNDDEIKRLAKEHEKQLGNPCVIGG